MTSGADIDARNGIIADYRLGVPITGLTVSNVEVSDIYLRGIYSSTDHGTFTFTHDSVDNVQADPASIAIFAWDGSGVIADNHVTNASDAISANWSRGIQFLRNDVGRSASGVHTDSVELVFETVKLGGAGIGKPSHQRRPTVARRDVERGIAVGDALEEPDELKEGRAPCLEHSAATCLVSERRL